MLKIIMSNDIAKILINRKKYKDAKDVLNKIIVSNDQDLRANFLLGKTYYDLNDLNKSHFYFEKCNKINPNNPNILFNLALVSQGSGEISKAKEIYDKLLSINNKDIKSYYGLLKLGVENINKKLYQNLIKSLNDTKTTLEEKSLINFIISKIKKKEEDIDAEIKFLKLAHEQCYNSNIKFNKQSDFYYYKIIPNHYNKIKFNDKYKKSKSFNNANHIFIIGLPRSGSTLIETIIMHNAKKIYSVGEFHAFNTSMLEQISKEIYSKNFNADNYDLSLFSEKFQNTLIQKYDNFKKNNYLDKSLENFFNIEVILEFFPNAKFIHVKRNLKDNILGIYQTMLTKLSWAHNIDSIKKYVKNYVKIINYFKNKYPDIIFEINLEDLVNNKEVNVKELLNFLKIDYSENYLEYDKNEKLFNKTNSFLQVREKIKKNGDKKYLQYYHLLNQ